MTILLFVLILISVRIIECFYGRPCYMSKADIDKFIKPEFYQKNKCIFCNFRKDDISVRADVGPKWDAGGWNMFHLQIQMYRFNIKTFFRHERSLSPNETVFPYHEPLVVSSFSTNINALIIWNRADKHASIYDVFHLYLVWILVPKYNKLVVFPTNKYVLEHYLVIEKCYENFCPDGSYKAANKTCLKCDVGYYGFNCSGKCLCKNMTLCDRYGGYCGNNNCPIARGGKRCEIKLRTCPVNRFGPGCQHKCFCKHNDTCDINSGKCPRGCAANYYGQSCRHACLYGHNCLHKCNCAIGVLCNKTTGKCPLGACGARYSGFNCRKTCPDNKYGAHCQHRCNCLITSSCNITTGICIKGGCVDGWFGRKCDKECPNGQIYCQTECRCRNISDCSVSFDDCPNGCSDRYYGVNCKYQCPDNTYLINGSCVGKCRCANMRECDVRSGECGTSGCRSGFTGKSCDKRLYNDTKSGLHPCFWISMSMFLVLSFLTYANIIHKIRHEAGLKAMKKRIKETFQTHDE